ncbi:syndecan isoform X2 [Cephus cinctus]|uniref:Syndecan n=1 Tax=Cephus cinctus TaxID=211228 RepID=A0AAJ7BJH7_CEPCN|nr:syndecan isoform X2 [Cephus cinctus]
MQPRIYVTLAIGAAIFIGCNAAAAEKEQDSKERPAGGATYNSFPDDLYLDDQEALEGSGRGGGEVRDDLEASGSGLGPDDEDGDDGTSFNKHDRIESVPSKPIEPKAPYIDETIIKTKQTNIETVNRPSNEGGVVEQSGSDEHEEVKEETNEVYIMNKKDRASSFFAQPGVLAAVIGGAVVGLLCAILVVMFIVYRMRKKDEGSYALDEPRRSPAAQAYPKPGAPHHNREFYA